jgi:thiosulfate dehydrogenase [quinone] large subunit
MVLSLSLFLTVSWGASPWYTGADIVYLFASTPLLIGGSGGVLSLDGWLASAARRQPGAGEDRTRRVLLGGAAAVGVLVLLGIAAIARSSDSSSDTDSAEGSSGSTPSAGSSASSASSAPAGGSSTATAGGPELVATSAVAVGQGKQVKDPKSGDPAWVLQLSAGQFTALDAICPHQGCTVGFVSAKEGFACPCHGSRFAADGKLLGGPATRGLTSIPVTVADGAVRRA